MMQRPGILISTVPNATFDANFYPGPTDNKANIIDPIFSLSFFLSINHSNVVNFEIFFDSIRRNKFFSLVS